MNTSPVALFAYNRADNTRRTIEALLANTLARETELYVFSDGGKDDASWQLVNEVRAMLHEVEAEVGRTHALRAMHIVERPVNFYLERNVIEGIGYVLSRHETIIVLEDDIVTSPHFLQFMNDACRIYRDEPRVMHVTGFTRITDSGGESYFTRFMAGWGWGTWRDRWQQHFRHYQSRAEALEGLTQKDIDTLQYGGIFPCLKNLDRSPIPWDVCWEIAIHRAEGLCLAPTHTLVRNIGLDAGTHFRSLDIRFSLLTFHCSLPLSRLIQRFEFDREPTREPITVTYATPTLSSAIEAAMADALRDWGIRYTWLGKLLRKAYHLFS